jgi:ATP-binding cassette subfamily B protein
MKNFSKVTNTTGVSMKHRQNKTAGRLFKLICSEKLTFSGTLTAAVVSVLTAIAVPALIGSSIDDITAGLSGGILTDAVTIAVLVIVSAAANYITQILAYSLAYGTAEKLRTALEQKINRLPLSFIDRTAKGDLINSVSVDTEILSDGLIQGIVQFLTGILTVIGTIIIMLCINAVLGFVVILITPLSLLTAKLITGRSKREFAAQSALRGALSAHSVEYIGSQQIVSAFNMENESIGKYRTLNGKLRKVGFLAQLFSALVNPTTRFVNGLVYTFTGFVGFMMILGVIPDFGNLIGIGTGTVTIGVLASFLTYANQYTKPFNDISATYAELQNGFASAKRIFSLLDEPEETFTESDINADLHRELSFENLHFSYIQELEVLKGINFSALAGQRVAVVGPTGCGKTTLINLIERFYEPDSGRIAIDGFDIAGKSKNALRGNISMVLQDTFIFDGTVADNIRYGVAEASDEDVIAAAKTVGAHGFIKRMENAYNTHISDADNLSAGQKQLLCIARVMLLNTAKKTPDILILDEATSNIDTVTEQKISKAAAKLMEGRTSIIIAHRLRTIKDADLIIVMDAGHIVQSGVHEKLIEEDGLYRNMYLA